jgi:Acetyltransferase (GNAT) family
MAHSSIKIKIGETWVTVPALDADGQTIIVKGSRIKVASLNAEDWQEKGVENPERCIARLKEERPSGLRADIFTFAQKIPEIQPKYNYPMEWDSIAAVQTKNFKEWWEKLPQETRKNVRRSQKRGVVVSVVELNDAIIQDLVELNNDAPLRQGKPYSHYGKTFERVKEDQSSFPDRSGFICAYLDQELVGYMKIVYRGNVASILHFLPKTSHQDKRPANALMAKAIELCEDKGVSYLIFGKFNYGKKQDNPLREFKIRNGFEEILVPRYYVPLTLWGKFCMVTKLHRGLVGILPRGFINLGVEARTKWYTLKNSQSRCSSTTERPNRIRQMGRSIPPAGSNQSNSIHDR